MYMYVFMTKKKKNKKNNEKQIMNFGRQNQFIFLIFLNILFFVARMSRSCREMAKFPPTIG